MLLLLLIHNSDTRQPRPFGQNSTCYRALQKGVTSVRRPPRLGKCCAQPCSMLSTPLCVCVLIWSTMKPYQAMLLCWGTLYWDFTTPAPCDWCTVRGSGQRPWQSQRQSEKQEHIVTQLEPAHSLQKPTRVQVATKVLTCTRCCNAACTF